jgi:heterodisulfide reductase subunit C
LDGTVEDREVEIVSLMLQRAVKEMATEVCDQCGKCPSACPVAGHIETFNPRQIVAKVSLGRMSELLESDEIWMCTSCQKCKERCPENISPYDLILILRNLAVRGGYPYPEGYDTFIDTVIESGSSQEPRAQRTRADKACDRSALDLPEVEKPEDMEAFRKIVRGFIRRGGSS